MRSSRVICHAWLVECAVWLALFVAACSAAPVSTQTAARNTATPAIAPCMVTGVSSPDAETAAKLRQTIEKGPLYAALASTAAVTTCRVAVDSGKIALEYTFNDGGSLRVTHDSRIEYTDQAARFASPPSEDPVAVLTRVEQSSFGANGCGINWRQPVTQPATDDAKSTERIYRGETCNCQARVRTDAGGRIVGLAFRSAC